MRWLIPLLLLTGCPPDPCEPRGEPKLVLGRGTGGAFEPLSDRQDVGLDVAPQGGFGVTVQASTTGLRTGAVVLDVGVEQGAESLGEFTIESIRLYCQEDNSGLLWGAVVGFDPQRFRTNDDLLALDGEVVTLVVTATDGDGVTAEGRADVTIQVGE